MKVKFTFFFLSLILLFTVSLNNIIELNKLNMMRNNSSINTRNSNFYNKQELPKEKLIISYCSGGEVDEKVDEAVENGSNVIIWFALNLVEENGKQVIYDNNLNYIELGKKVKKFKEAFPTRTISHLISIGGWNAPHISTSFSAWEWFEFLDNWNKNVVANQYFDGFQGFDWDLEGNDDLKSEFNHFTKPTLDLMGELSQLLKAHGYIVSMAPAESYFDSKENGFSLSLQFNPSWMGKDTFLYHGKNVYAYLYFNYKNLNQKMKEIYTKNFFTNTEQSMKNEISTYDFISIQL